MNKSTSNLKKRKHKRKTQRGGMFYKCYDNDGNIKRKWMPCSYSKLSKVNPKLSQVRRDNESRKNVSSESQSQSKTTRNQRSFGSTLRSFGSTIRQNVNGVAEHFGPFRENFDTFTYGPQLQKEAQLFLDFLHDTKCCRDFETKVIQKFFKPVTPKNLSILRFIVENKILLNDKPIQYDKHNVLEHLLSKLDKEQSKRSGIYSGILLRNRKTLKRKIVEDELDKYDAFLRRIEKFDCSEGHCSDFERFLSNQVAHDKFFFYCLEHIQLHEILPDNKLFDLKRQVIKQIVDRGIDRDISRELKERSDISVQNASNPEADTSLERKKRSDIAVQKASNPESTTLYVVKNYIAKILQGKEKTEKDISHYRKIFTDDIEKRNELIKYYWNTADLGAKWIIYDILEDEGLKPDRDRPEIKAEPAPEWSSFAGLGWSNTPQAAPE